MSVHSTNPEARAQKVAWSGTIVAVQPRVRLIRCYDERQHSYHGYVLRIEGMCGGESGEVMHRRGSGGPCEAWLSRGHGSERAGGAGGRPPH